MLLLLVANRCWGLSPSRRWVLRGAAASVCAPLPSNSIISGSRVSSSEAAASGAVALWIDLDGCEICRHDVPAACSGTLVAPDLVLSAQHCIDIPEELDGRLTKVVFGTDIFDETARTVDVERYVRPSDVGFQRSDLVLIKLKRPAPKTWRVARVGGGGGGRLTLYGFGDAVDDPEDYTSGQLRKLEIKALTPRDAPSFYTKTTLASGSGGSCNGDSGGPALDDQARVLGILSSNSMPCAGSTGLFLNPDYFRDFLRRASRDLGSPLDI